MIWAQLITFFFGAFLGLAELLSRYRDAPGFILKSDKTYVYLLANGLLSLASLFLLETFGQTILINESADNEVARLTQKVLLAGFGGAAFFRSSIMKAKLSDTELGVGPSFVIDILLAIIDREIDRERATRRVEIIPEKMRDIPARFAANELKETCFEAMQNLSAAEKDSLRIKVDYLFNQDGTEEAVKSILVGLNLVNYVGEKTLFKTIDRLEPEIESVRQAIQAAASVSPEDIEALL